MGVQGRKRNTERFELSKHHGNSTREHRNVKVCFVNFLSLYWLFLPLKLGSLSLPGKSKASEYQCLTFAELLDPNLATL